MQGSYPNSEVFLKLLPQIIYSKTHSNSEVSDKEF